MRLATALAAVTAAALVGRAPTRALTGGSGSSGTLVTFFDWAQVADSTHDSVKLRVQQPVKADVVIRPSQPWESWAVFGYNSVLRVAPNDLRMYYDCIEGDGVPPGATGQLGQRFGGAISHRRICVAQSTDGITWTKPDLGLFNRSGSTANNIVLENSGVSVFLDANPAAPASQKWKMACSNAAYASPDGFHWSELPFEPIAEDDTKPTAQWDPATGKYVIFVRRDVPGAATRCIGRCDTTNFSNWQEEVPAGATGCPVVFCADAHDPAEVDVYTNAWTPYPSVSAPDAVNLFFPSFYHHFSASAPYGFGNDGLLDIRLTFTRRLADNLSYVPADNGRAPFVPLGINTCGELASRPSVRNGWCTLSPNSSALNSTAFDTSAMYMASGFLPSNDGAELFLYHSGQPFTHGSDGAKGAAWGNNTGIQLLRLRRDGFVALEAPYDFSAGSNRSAYPSFVTLPLRLPASCSAPPPAPAPAPAPTTTTSCGYEYPPANECPPDAPVGKCKTTADCVAYDTGGPSPTCHGVEAHCNASGACTTGVAGGDLCVLTSGNSTAAAPPHVYVNMQTSVVGWVAVEVLQGGVPVPGCELAASDLLKGDSVAARATWGQVSGARDTCDVAALAAAGATDVALRVAMVDAKLFSLRVACSAQPSD